MYFNLIDAWPLFCSEIWELSGQGRGRQGIQLAAYAIQLV